MPSYGSQPKDPVDLYLDLLKEVLTRRAFGETWRAVSPPRDSWRHAVYKPLDWALARLGLRLVRRRPFDEEARRQGRDWPFEGETMIGHRRLENLHACIAEIIRRNVPGDLIETGVWRGGAAIFMRAVLEALGDTGRRVWAADSFRGLPKPPGSRALTGPEDTLWKWDQLAVSLDNVKRNFEKYGLLDERVRFLEGWFHETLPTAPIEKLALMRVDADMYESTRVALDILYPKLSVGGYVIVDDYNDIEGCKRAVDEFRRSNEIEEEIISIDWSGVFWRREQ